MTLFVILFHVIACITLILVVLLQAGSESGLSGGLGGGGSDSLLGAKSNTFLTKFTTVMAVIFMISSLSLAVVAAKGSKSIMMSKETAVLPVPDKIDVVDKTAKTVDVVDAEKTTESFEQVDKQDKKD